MSPFQEATLPPEALDVDATMRKHGITRAQAELVVGDFLNSKVFMNDRFQVNVSRMKAPFGERMGDVLWLNIKRRNRAPLHNWRELQTIKNLIVGPEHEGFELYPAESRLVDSANSYHLFVFEDPTIRLPVGWRERLVGSPEDAAAVGATQRPFTKGKP